MKIGVVSDTHIPRRAVRLPNSVMDGLRGVDLILHAGDILDRSVMNQLSLLAPVEAVAGNCDPADLAAELGTKKMLHLAGHEVGLIHGDGPGATTTERAFRAFPAADVIIFGHSHQARCEVVSGVLMLNPGSPTDKRWEERFSYALLWLEEGLKPRAELIYF